MDEARGTGAPEEAEGAEVEIEDLTVAGEPTGEVMGGYPGDPIEKPYPGDPLLRRTTGEPI